MDVRRHDVRCVWPAEAMLGEGPLWIAEERALYWVDIQQSRLHRYAPETQRRETCALPTPLTSIVPAAQGMLLGTGLRRLHVMDAHGGRLARVEELTIGDERTRINDGCCHPDGAFWFGTMALDEKQPLGDFFRLAGDGSCERIAAGFAITNGPAFSIDGKTGYFVATVERRIFYATLSDGRLAGAFEPFAEIPANDGFPDGLAIDDDGGIWCAHFGGHRVTRFDARGRISDVIHLPVANVTKCAFGGRQLDRLYITTARKGLDAHALKSQPLAGGLFEADVGYRGLAPARYRGALRTAAASSTCFFETS